jgi:Flp pilus assembly protein TadG
MELKHGRPMKALVRSRAGGAAMEFALVAPLMLLLVAAIAQYGALMFTYASMQNGARSAARQLALGSVTAVEAEASATAALPGWVPTGDWVVDARDSDTTGTDLVDVSISVPASKATVFSVVPMPAELAVTVTMPEEEL